MQYLPHFKDMKKFIIRQALNKAGLVDQVALDNIVDHTSQQLSTIEFSPRPTPVMTSREEFVNNHECEDEPIRSSRQMS
jgi:hypothetical protein